MDPLTIPTDRPPPDSKPETKELDLQIQAYIADLVMAVESRLEAKFDAFTRSVGRQITGMNDHLQAISSNTKSLVEATNALRAHGDILLKAHQENLSMARELGIVWSEKERARLEAQRDAKG